jgi:hypothetical protein
MEVVKLSKQKERKKKFLAERSVKNAEMCARAAVL